MFLVLCVSLGFAQDSGIISGTVTDSSGASVAGAKVTLLNVGTSTTQEALTNSAGEYLFTPVRIGKYTLKVEMKGFSTESRSGLILNVQQHMLVDFSLTIGQLEETVVIKSDTPLLDNDTSSIGQVIQNKSILDLPLNGRDYQQLAVLTSGTVPTGGTSPNNITRGAADFSANGARPLQNNFLLDGADNNSYVLDLQSGSSQAVAPSVDAMQEFKVQNNNFGAEFGRYGGAVINATIKSGTNELHGTAFEFLRNDAVDANNFFNNLAGRALPPFRQNQFGGTAGGPLRKNKLFLFGSYQGTRIAQGVTYLSTVPTAAEHNGLFAQPIYDPGSTRANPAGSGFIRDLFPGNQVPSNKFDSTGKKTLDVYPMPNLPGTANNYILNPPTHSSTNQYDARFDLNLSSSDSLFGRYSLTDASSVTPGALPSPAVGQVSSAGTPTTIHGAVLSETHTFRNRIVNEFRAGFNRLSATRLNESTDRLIEAFGFKGIPYYSYIGGLPTIGVTGYSGIGENGTLPNIKLSQVTQFTDSVSFIKGGHSLKAGADIRFIISNAVTPSGTRGNYNFSGAYTQNPQSRTRTGDGAADLLLGTAQTATMGTPTLADLRQRYYGFYAQDDWHVSRNLTLNLGVRLDMDTPFWDHHDRMANFIIDPGPDYNTLVLAGSRGSSVEDRALIKFYKNQFAPRVGLAYRLPHKAVFRASYGIFNAGTMLFGINNRTSFNPPFTESYSYTGDQVSTPFLLTQGFPANALQPTINQVNRQVISYQTALPNGYMEQWAGDLQKELPFRLLLDLGYSASVGHKLTTSRNADQPTPGPGTTQSREPFPQYTSILRIEPAGNSTYHALEAKLERRFSTNLTFLAAYTWSHFLDDNPTLLDQNTAGVQNAYYRRGEKGNSSYDLRQRFVGSYAYLLPVGKGQHFLNRGGLLNAIVGGWQLNGILTMQAGRPFTPTLSVNVSNSAGGSQRPDRASSGLISYGDRTISHWFDTAAFTTPLGFSFGNSGRNILTGPRLVVFDASLFKMFPINERIQLQIRFESFNAFNHANFALPNASIGTAAAGTISGTVGTPRQNQVALKLLF
jgi:hypothetical protein